MNLAEKQLQITKQLGAVKNGQDRLAVLVAAARLRPPLASALRLEDHLIPGCLAKLWFVARIENSLCWFDCDSDSLIVKAIAGLLCDFYSGHTPGQILAHDPAFLTPLGITQHLTPNRRNALARVWEQLRAFAQTNLS